MRILYVYRVDTSGEGLLICRLQVPQPGKAWQKEHSILNEKSVQDRIAGASSVLGPAGERLNVIVASVRTPFSVPLVLRDA